MGKVMLRMQNAKLWSALMPAHLGLDEPAGKKRAERMADADSGAPRAQATHSFDASASGFAQERDHGYSYGRESGGNQRPDSVFVKHIVAPGFRQWRRAIEDDKVSRLRSQLDRHKAARAQQLIAMWRMRSLTPVFKAWKAHGQAARGRKKQLMGKVVLRMQNAKLWASWRQWAKVVDQLRVNSLKNDMAAGLHAQKKRRIQALMARWQKGSLVGVFRGWRKFAATSCWGRSSKLWATWPLGVGVGRDENIEGLGLGGAGRHVLSLI
jgi:hypothetical protein